MSFSDAVHLLFNNPLTNTCLTLLKSVAPAKKADSVIVVDSPPLWKQASQSSLLIKFAALSGATAVIIWVVGIHVVPKEPDANAKDPVVDPDYVKFRRDHFDIGNKFHFYHSLALLCTPFCRHPVAAGNLLLLGMLSFSGSCYYIAFGKVIKKDVARTMTGLGILVLSAGWLTMLL